MTYRFKIENDCLSEITHFDAVSGNKNVYECEFEITCNDEEALWFAVFKEGDAVYIAPVSDGKCSIPYEILEHAGYAYMGCYAECGENKRISTNWLPIKIEEGAYSEGTAPSEPSKELWETLLRNSVPVIGENGNWFTYDMQEGRYEDTGFSARGAQGPQGPKGDTGAQGPKGDKGDTGDSVILSALFKSPKNFGKSVNGTVGDNIKVYADITGETVILIGSGETYNASSSDAYMVEVGLRSNNVRRIYIGEGITTLGKYFLTGCDAGRYNQNVVNMEAGTVLGTVSCPIVFPKSLTAFNNSSCYAQTMTHKAVINGEGDLVFGNYVFSYSWLQEIEINNATSMSYSSSTFTSLSKLKTFTINSACNLETNISFADSPLLTADSLVNIANHLKAIGSGETAQTLTLHNTAKTLCTNTVGTVSEGVFTKATGGNTTLTDFITNTKGWTIA